MSRVTQLLDAIAIAVHIAVNAVALLALALEPNGKTAA